VDHSAHSPAAHERAVQWIPWLVNGTLPSDQAAALRAHLASCARCRSDYDSEKRLYEAIRTDSPLAVVSESSFAKLMARIEAPDDAHPDRDRDATEPPATSPAPIAMVTREPALAAKRRRPRRPWYASTTVRWVAAAVVIETLALGLAVWMWHAPQRAEGAAYQTLTASAPRYGSGPRVRIVFKSTLTLEALQKLLRSVEAHIVDGPTDAQVYTLGFAQPITSAELDARIATLRANAQVLFAELAAPDTAAR
jgi:hypothetical protein